MGWARPPVDHVLLEVREKGRVVATGIPDDPHPFDAILWRLELQSEQRPYSEFVTYDDLQRLAFLFGCLG